ncbi:uncharacterized protein LOC143212568 [Lasioglossum baleicum]|uniref:uncharacterized protein LOC143212568 n=1 Tax=Lasioglossum baleicum TaxID=434251 RepID=UPI003FCCBD32
MARDWSNTTKPGDRVAMMEVARITRKTIVASTVTVAMVVLVYTVRYYFTAKYTDQKLYFQSKFPYDVDTNPNFQLTVFGQLAGCAYAAISYTAVDTFIAMLVLHICGQLSILRLEILNLRENGEEKLEIVLKRIVQRHQYINMSVSGSLPVHLREFNGAPINCGVLELHGASEISKGKLDVDIRIKDVSEESLSSVLSNDRGLFQQDAPAADARLYAATLLSVFPSDHAMSRSQTFGGKEKILMYIQIFFLSLYVLYIMAQLYLYCYVGDKLTMESREIANAAYDCAWYNLSSRNAKLLIIIMCRDMLPLRITAGRFCSFTLQLYSELNLYHYLQFFLEPLVGNVTGALLLHIYHNLFYLREFVR